MCTQYPIMQLILHSAYSILQLQLMPAGRGCVFLNDVYSRVPLSDCSPYVTGS
jgi:hypothetical protein